MASLAHHSDRGTQYVGIRGTGRLAETINGLSKAGLIHRRARRFTYIEDNANNSYLRTARRISQRHISKPAR